MSDHRRIGPLPRPRYVWRRALGLVTAITVVLGSLTYIASLAGGIPMQTIAKFSIVPRHKYVPTKGPVELALLGAPPNSSISAPLPRSDAVHAIAVYPRSIDMIVGGKITHKIALQRPVTDLSRLTMLVHDSAWLSEPTVGTFVLKAALIVGKGTNMAISAPAARQLQLVDNLSVFVGAWRGSLMFRGVTVEATKVDPKSYYRPFVVGYGAGTDLRVIDSRFTGLGWNWSQSYGTSWVNGARGGAVGSTFDHNYFGAYTSQTQDIVFSHDVFAYNELYGLDPHTYSNHLLITHVTAVHNGAHGIIFSVNVTHSVIEYSYSAFNGENGIMMDAASTGNRIIGDTVANNVGDGLVTASSPNNLFAGDTSTHNRVGMRIRPYGSTETVTGNLITSNKLAIEGIHLSASNVTRDNGGQYDLRKLVRIWSVAGALWLMLVAGSLLLIPGQRRRYVRALSVANSRRVRGVGVLDGPERPELPEQKGAPTPTAT